jgi:hypothetical protein
MFEYFFNEYNTHIRPYKAMCSMFFFLHPTTLPIKAYCGSPIEHYLMLESIGREKQNYYRNLQRYPHAVNPWQDYTAETGRQVLTDAELLALKRRLLDTYFRIE